MWTIFKKEITSFFSSIIGYIAIVVYLVALWLFLWVFPETNLFDYGYANLDYMFQIAPWIFLFLIPPITMRLFAEELKTGTIEIIATRPISDFQIIFGKYFAALVLLLFALLPTAIYYLTIYWFSLPLSNIMNFGDLLNNIFQAPYGFPPSNIDNGAILGSYIGLFFLGASFVSIGLFGSILTRDQIVAFIISTFLCFFFYAGFNYISEFPIFYGKMDYWLQEMGIRAHYNSISRGVIDTRDLVYFVSVIATFLMLTKTALESRKW